MAGENAVQEDAPEQESQVIDDTSADAGVADEGDEGTTQQGAADEEFGGATQDEIAVARANGWAGKAGWKGDPSKFETAKSFADRSLGINAVLRKELGRRDQEIGQIKRDVAQFQQLLQKSNEKQLNEAIATLRAERVQAINEGDGAKVDKTEREIATLQQQAAQAATKPAAAPAELQPTPEQHTAVREFQARNPWFDVDRGKTRVAIAVGDELRRERPDLVGNPPGYLAELESRLKQEYPEMFVQNHMRTARTEGGDPPRTAARVVKPKGYDDLPKEAKEACERLMRQGVIRKKDDYAKTYWEGQ